MVVPLEGYHRWLNSWPVSFIALSGGRRHEDGEPFPLTHEEGVELIAIGVTEIPGIEVVAAGTGHTLVLGA